MKIGRVHINGKDYPMCFNTQVMIELEDRNGKTAQEELETILNIEGTKIKDLFWLLHTMMVAGADYIKEIEGRDVEVLTEKQMAVLISPAEYKDVFGDVRQAVIDGQKTKVEIEQKNAVTTPTAD